VNLATTVLAIVDVQNGFITDRSAHIVAPIHDLTRRWLDRGGAAIFTRYFNTPGSSFERLMDWSRLQEAPETDLVPELRELAARPGAVVLDKKTYTLFNDEGAALVKSRAWTDVAVVGIATESCVLKTAADAFEAGLTPWVITDAVYSHAGAQAHEAGLLVAGRFIGRGQLIESHQLLATLDDHPTAQRPTEDARKARRSFRAATVP